MKRSQLDILIAGLHAEKAIIQGRIDWLEAQRAAGKPRKPRAPKPAKPVA